VYTSATFVSGIIDCRYCNIENCFPFILRLSLPRDSIFLAETRRRTSTIRCSDDLIRLVQDFKQIR
jgi:hypothetical protein